jgi:hypothetical protein
MYLIKVIKYLINISCQVLYKKTIANMYKMSKNVTFFG